MTTSPSERRSVPDLLAAASAEVDAELDRALPAASDPPERIHEAMRYSVFSGGKRLRPALALTVADALDIPHSAVLPSACAVELIHAFSLVHDDLPAMDDDDLRRGRPTNHKVYGEAIAILAGDALSVVAFEILATRTPDRALAAELCAMLAEASGTRGMIGGQVLDLIAERREPDRAFVDEIHRLKTSALISASAAMAAKAGGAPAAAQAAIRRYGDLLGRAFQIADDVLDETSSPEALGKGTQKDRARGKMTYPAVAGLAESRSIAAELAAEAARVAAPFDRRGELSALAEFVVTRKN